MHSTRITAAVAGVVLLVGGLSACNDGAKASGSGGGGSDAAGGDKAAQGPADALKAAKAATAAKNSAKFDGTTETTTSSGRFKQTTKGGLDWSQGMQMNVENTLTGDKSPTGGKPIKALYTQDAVYMNAGSAMPGAGGKPWVKYSYEALSKQMGASGTAVKDVLDNANPSQPIDVLIASGTAKVVGKEKVNGVEATHYTGTVSMADLSKNLGKEIRDAVQKQLEQGGAKSEKLDLWIDGDNLLVKKEEHVAGKMPTDATAFYSDYGTKVSVEAPPASQTMTAPAA
ncbi:hypothetical protein [Streptomyces sp. NPDC059080]|uniref:hypothetical protein n=1 Tax=Streptomyces sp. NPDC059080 TaxID=3346718 RepID=UPI0036A8F4A2